MWFQRRSISRSLLVIALPTIWLPSRLRNPLWTRLNSHITNQLIIIPTTNHMRYTSYLSTEYRPKPRTDTQKDRAVNSTPQLEGAWDWNEFEVDLKLVGSIVAGAAERGDIPFVVTAISLLHMCADQVFVTATVSAAYGCRFPRLIFPVFKPGRIASRRVKPSRSINVLHFSP